MTGAEARATIRSRFVTPPQPEPVAQVSNQMIPGPGRRNPVRVYRPVSLASAAFQSWYTRTGADSFCDLDSHDGLCRNFANRFGGLVISVHYRLAPEHPWPPRPKTSMRLRAVGGAPRFEDLGADPGRVVGRRRQCRRQRCRCDRPDGPGPRHPPSGQLLLVPGDRRDFGTDPTGCTAEGYYNPKPALRWYWDQYVPLRGRPASPVCDAAECGPPRAAAGRRGDRGARPAA